MSATRPTSVRLAIVLASVTLASATASAQPLPPGSLRWSAPSACPSATEALGRITSLTRGATPTSAPWSVRVVLARRSQGGVWSAEITSRSGVHRSFRRLRARSCAEAAEAVVVLLAWMIAPDRSDSTEEETSPRTAPERTHRVAAPPAVAPATVAVRIAAPPRANVPAPLAVRVPTPAPVLPPVPVASRGPRWRVSAGVGVDLSVGLVPSAAPGLAAWISLRRARWQLVLDGVWTPAIDATVTGRPTQGGSFSAWRVGLSACHGWIFGRVQVGPCIGLDGGQVLATGFGVTNPDSATEPLVALTAGGRLSWRVMSWFGLWATARGGALLVTPRYVLTGVGEVFAASALTGDLRVGAGVWF